MTNNEKFNRMLNGCSRPRAVMAILSALAAEPVVQQADHIGQKRQVIVGELLSLTNETKLYQEAV